jgi:phosphoribosylanthranilate isomerase
MLSNLFPGRIKICGITNLDDALAAIDCGAQTLGFVFHAASPRCVSVQAARLIIGRLGPLVSIGVFVDQAPQHVRAVVNECGLTAVQCHGNEADEWLAELADLAELAGIDVPVVKAVRIRTAEDIARLNEFPSAAALLMDAWSPQAAGGSGARWDWSLAATLPRLSKPLVMAGGLTPDNVAAAIRLARPAAVDVSSGVEATPGRKDHEKLRRFVAAAQEAFDEERSPSDN